jgi:hypothetical protein
MNQKSCDYMEWIISFMDHVGACVVSILAEIE